MIKRFFRWLFRREDIGGVKDPYLTRYHLLYTPLGRLYLHWFRRSDNSRCLHDHPCSVWTFVFRGSYIEQLPDGTSRTISAPSIRRFPAEHLHRVEVPVRNKTWSICWFGRRRRTWGFLTKKGWMNFKNYFYNHPDGGGC